MIGTPLASGDRQTFATMRTPLALLACLGLLSTAQAQFQVNPQFGINYQHLTGSAPEGTTYKAAMGWQLGADLRSEEHTSELQSRENLVCRLLLEKKKTLDLRWFMWL